ncbi:hypothetical protein NH340_JMT08352 [Sarcoptes scabiei]|nr:hypothetical protein NH340_JMT08352 [Sarcoptes scabiei]
MNLTNLSSKISSISKSKLSSKSKYRREKEDYNRIDRFEISRAKSIESSTSTSSSATSSSLSLLSEVKRKSQSKSEREMIETDPKTISPGQDGLGVFDRKLYNRLYYLSQTISVLLLILILIWVYNYLNGFGFDDPSQTFNYHPMFMFIGFILIYSNAILIYRSFRLELKQKLKIWHASMNAIAMIIAFFGSVSVIYFHHKMNITHFYSLHSWLGISTWSLFILQFITGFTAFLFPTASFGLRKMLMPYHRYVGVCTFVLASATCLTGLNEKAIFAFKNPAYSSLAMNGILTNSIGLLLCIYCSLVVFLVTKIEYQRKPLPEEQIHSKQ